MRKTSEGCCGVRKTNSSKGEKRKESSGDTEQALQTTQINIYLTQVFF